MPTARVANTPHLEARKPRDSAPRDAMPVKHSRMVVSMRPISLAGVTSYRQVCMLTPDADCPALKRNIARATISSEKLRLGTKRKDAPNAAIIGA
jgi:hypothetical protein